MYLLAAIACIGGSSIGWPWSIDDGTDEPAVDGALEDVNPTSDTYGEFVSPSDQLGRVSVWYFGHAT